MKSKWTNAVLGSKEYYYLGIYTEVMLTQYLTIHTIKSQQECRTAKARIFPPSISVIPSRNSNTTLSIVPFFLCIFQGQPYSFWVSAFTLAGEGQVSEIVAETPQVSIPAGIASFSQKVIHAVKESVEMSCIMVGIPYPTLSWTKK